LSVEIASTRMRLSALVPDDIQLAPHDSRMSARQARALEGRRRLCVELQQGCLYACLPTDVLDKDKRVQEQCQWFSLRVDKAWLTYERREARREANLHRLESGSDFDQDVSSEVDPESPNEGAGAGDEWGVPGGGVEGAGPGDSDDSLERGRPRRSRTPLGRRTTAYPAPPALLREMPPGSQRESGTRGGCSSTS